MRIALTYIVLSMCFMATSLAETERVGIKVSKPSVLSFSGEIVDVDLGNQDYSAKIKGKNLLICARKKDSYPTTLFVRYGDDKDSYVAEIYPDDNAPLQRFIGGHQPITGNPNKDWAPQQQDVKPDNIFSPNEEQEYYNYGVNKDNVKVVLTNIAHKGDSTYLRIFIKNNTTISLTISSFSFEYITYLRKFIFFKSKKTKVVTPIAAPSSLELGPNDANYFVFAIPTYTSNGGLEVFLGESDKGEREFKISIPNRVLLKDKRK